MQKEFTKKDLKTGMIVEYRNKERRIVVGGILYGETGCEKISFYNENLLEESNFTKKDIMRVYETKYCLGFNALFNDNNLELIWKREEVKHMTTEEMRKKLEEFTNGKIDIEPSKNEMVGALYLLCSKMKMCRYCYIKEECRKNKYCTFANYTEEEVKKCYKKVIENEQAE